MMKRAFMTATAGLLMAAAAGCTITTQPGAAPPPTRHEPQAPPTRVHQGSSSSSSSDRATSTATVDRTANWEALGAVLVDRTKSTETITVNASEGKFRRLRFQVRESAMDLYDMVVYFRDGTRYSPGLKKRFQEGDRSAIIDLPGDARAIRQVTFSCRDVSGGARSAVALWGQR